MPAPSPTAPTARWPEVFRVFLRLGLTSFGGPTAHLGYFHAEFVRRRRWLSEHTFADLIALCQFLPGPASSQAAFAIGMDRAGLPGALAASLAFLAPSAALMIACAFGLRWLEGPAGAGAIQGLILAATAVVALAIVSMARALCMGLARASIAVTALALTLITPGAGAQLLAIATGALLGWVMLATTPATTPAAPAQASSDDAHSTASPTARSPSRGPVLALVACALVVALALLPVWAPRTAPDVAAHFARAGSLVFGGGHVVLPMLREFALARGVSDETFLAGYGAAQAMPGPLFSFAGYLGAAMHGAAQGAITAIAWGMLALLAVFLPGWLLIAGARPFWTRLRRHAHVQGLAAGASSAVVGVLLAAWLNPMLRESVRSWPEALLVLAWMTLLSLRVPPVAVVLASALVGVLRALA